MAARRVLQIPKHGVSDQAVEPPNVDALVEVHLDVPGAGPELKFGVEIERARGMLGTMIYLLKGS